MDITEALAFLNSHYNFESGITNDVAGVAPWVAPPVDRSQAQSPRRLDPPSLSRMRRLLTFLGDPQLDVPILHITAAAGDENFHGLASIGRRLAADCAKNVDDETLIKRYQTKTAPVAGRR